MKSCKLSFKKRKPKLIAILTLSFIALMFFGYMDSQQIKTIHKAAETQPNIYDDYNKNQQPVLMILWYGIFFTSATIYWLFTKDFSESAAIFLVPAIMQSFGWEDVWFYVLSPFSMTPQMCWFTYPQKIVSWLMNEACVTPKSLILNAFVGLILAVVIGYVLVSIKKR